MIQQKAILENRNYLMGIAMILVIVYHFTCWVGLKNLLFPFRYGFIGVDIFLYLSAVGLGFSASKYPYMQFVKRRIIRIMPLYIFAAVIDSFLFYFTNDKSFGLWDLFCNITSLSYYGLGGFLRDWYLSSLLLLYLIFPILTMLVCKFKLFCLVVSVFVSFLLVYFVDLPFQYNCFISRIPIFLFGIFIYQKMIINSDEFILRYSLFSAILGLCLLVYACFENFKLIFISTALVTPIVIEIIVRIPKIFYTKVSLIGKYSLELYIANICIHRIVDLINPVYAKALVYIAGNILLALFMIPINRYCGQILQKKYVKDI